MNHPDLEYREFLRAGAVRVVLPIRPGSKEQIISLIELAKWARSRPGTRLRKSSTRWKPNAGAARRGVGAQHVGTFTPTGALDLEVAVKAVSANP